MIRTWLACLLALTTALGAGCGATLTEGGGTEVPDQTEQPSETPVRPYESRIVAPGATETFPSYLFDETRIEVQGYGERFQSVEVHMWCTTGESVNNVHYSVVPGQVLKFRWKCQGRRVWLHSLGTGYNQDLQVITH